MSADDRSGDVALSPRRQWLVVAVLVGVLVGFPVAILVWPPTLLSFQDAYLGLALVPGLVLGATVVWLATRRP
ncbi:MAG: hypothetical protein ABEJ57_06810 [Halobacteriaceae archaeon]